MFESLQLVGAKLVVKLNYNFEQRSEKLLDKLAKHLRARLGGAIKMIQYETGSPPTTRTIVI